MAAAAVVAEAAAVIVVAEAAADCRPLLETASFATKESTLGTDFCRAPVDRTTKAKPAIWE